MYHIIIKGKLDAFSMVLTGKAYFRFNKKILNMENNSCLNVLHK